jgi:RNA polymerase sigma factor (sigma-70 family)
MALWHKLLLAAPVSPLVPAGSDVDFLNHLDRRYRRPLVNYFEKRIRESYDVEDLVQEVFIRLSHRQNLQEIEYLEGYIFQTAVNVMRDRARRQAVRKVHQHEPLEECELPTNDYSPERVLQGRQQLERAITALSELPDRTQQVFVLRLYEGLKQEEIATRLKMSVEGVRFHLRRAKAHITQSVEQDA